MKHFYLLPAFIFFFLAGQAQSTPHTTDTALASRMRTLFDYLLRSSRLNILQQDNITVLDLVNDAALAGYHIDTAGCSVLRDNLRKPFYTLTPGYLRIPGYIVAPQDSSYYAMAGDLKLTFTSTSVFEHKLGSFYSKNCRASDTVEYTLAKVPAFYSKFTIRHYPQPGFAQWYVSYTDQYGRPLAVWLTAGDTLFQAYGIAIHMVQDVDRINNVHSPAVYTQQEDTDPGYVVEPVNFYRAPAAVLKIEPGHRKTPVMGLAIKTGENPATGYFRLTVNATQNEPVRIRLVDAAGRPVEMVTTSGGNTVAMGRNAIAGIYYAEVFKGSERQVIRLVKK